MFAPHAPRPLSRLPLVMALPFLIGVGVFSLASKDTAPIWPITEAQNSAPNSGQSSAPQPCVMLLSDLGPPAKPDLSCQSAL